jgi:hypothetical protein
MRTAQRSIEQRGTGIDEKVITTSLRPAARLAVMKASSAGASDGADAKTERGSRRKTKSVRARWAPQSAGRLKVAECIGSTIGTACSKTVSHVPRWRGRP